jgi:hypothetical protein
VHCLITLAPSPAALSQVKVWLGDTKDHHYILSRVLISRMLTVTKIPYVKVRAAWRSMAQHGAAWRSMAQHDAAWRSMAQHGAAWRSMVQHGGRLKLLPA